VVHEDPPRAFPESNFYAHSHCTLSQSGNDLVDHRFNGTFMVDHAKLLGPSIEVCSANKQFAPDAKRRQRRYRPT
jgi:hypothetical protein